jgi:hypothetical protein
MEKKLKVKPSNFKTDLSFHEWVMKFNVGSCYTEPTKFFQGNSTTSIRPMESSSGIQRFFRLLGF